MNEREMLPEEEKVLELRMFYFVPYNISDKQMGIQAGHCFGRMLLKYGRKDPQHPVWDFVENHETTIMLNGGTFNDERDFDGVAKGSMNQIGDQLVENDIEFAYFHEPDMNNGLSALCFICDERVFDKKAYPYFPEYVFSIPVQYEEASWKSITEFTEAELIEKFPKEYKEWVRLIGGVKNVFLKNLIKDKHKA